MTNPKYMRPGRDFAIGKLVEELGELQAALGKMLRWGPDSYNPELPPEQRETNSAWVEREIEDVIGAITNYRASVRAAAMSDLIAGDADMYDTPSARITGDKDRENPVEGAQPAPSDELVERVAHALWLREAERAAPNVARGRTMARFMGIDTSPEERARWMDMARVAIAAVGQDTRSQVEREIVAWLRAENGLCDCYARSEGECACGAWDDYKVRPLCDIADAIEQGQYRSEGNHP